MRLSRLWQCREPFFWLYDFAARRLMMRKSRQQLEASHNRRFRRLMRLVSRKSPYYREVMQQRGLDPETCELHQFPVLTRQLLVERFDDIVTDRRLSRDRIATYLAASESPDNLYENRYHVIHTSGTTGRRAYMAYSPREWIRGISHQIRFAGGLKWRKRCAFVGITNGHFAGHSIAMAGRRGINRLFYDSRTFEITWPMHVIVSGLNEFQPHTISGYASMLSGLAEEQRAGRLHIRPQCLISSGEMLVAEQRRSIEEAFGQPVKDVYCATETLPMGFADAPGETMTLFEDDLLFEPQADHFYVTSLFHTTTPLIRYRFDDAITFVSRQDSSPLRSVGRVVGRSTESFRFLNNQGVEEEFASILLLDLETSGVTQYQIIYEGVSSFTFRVRLEQQLSGQQRSAVVEEVQGWLHQVLADKALDLSVSFSVEEVDRIPVDPRTGKVKLALRETEIPHAA